MAGGEESAKRVLAALRRAGHEAQLTQVIAAFAQDGHFASQIASTLLAHAPQGERVAALGLVPEVLICSPEEHLLDQWGADKGFVDLRFQAPDANFTLLVELKIDSGYGHEQLERYVAALGALAAETNSGLMAVTRDLPHRGEEGVCQWPSVPPQRRPSRLPTGGHVFSPLVAMVLPA